LTLAATIVEEELELVASFLPINKHRERERESKVREGCENVKRPREKVRGCQGQQPCYLVQQPCYLVQQCENNGS